MTIEELDQPEGIDSKDIPQADSFRLVRRVLNEIVRGGQSTAQLAKSLGISARNIRFCLHAARIVGWIQFESPQLAFEQIVQGGDLSNVAVVPVVTDTGLELLKTSPGSEEERLAVGTSLLDSSILSRVAGDFLASEISQLALAERLRQVSGISPTTADRRARTLNAWKRYALGAPEDGGDLKIAVPESDPALRHQSGATPLASLEERAVLPIYTRAYLRNQIAHARMVLVFAAGVSRTACTTSGEPPPTAEALSEAIWHVCLPGQNSDGEASVEDLVSLARTKKPKALAELLHRSFSIDPASVTVDQRYLFELPWMRAYSLTIDNLAEAVAERFNLPRRVLSISKPSARSEPPALGDPRSLSVIYLRGRADNGTASFGVISDSALSSDQYRLMKQFDTDFLAYPFVFIGDEHDVDLLWRHVERRGGKSPRGVRELRPKSFLVCPSLSIPRQSLLSEYNVEWIKATPEEFVRQVRAECDEQSQTGHARLDALAISSADSPANVRAVADLLAEEQPGTSEYLNGASPTWDDIQSGRAIGRESDGEIERIALDLIRQRRHGGLQRAPLLLLTGTAGSGKSTALMRLAMKLSAEGHSVGWVGEHTELSSKSISAFARTSHGFSVLAIDEVERFGRRSRENIAALSDNLQVNLVVAVVHSSRLEALSSLEEDDFVVKESAIPDLADTDIGLLIDVLEAEHRLGILTGKTRAAQEEAFRVQAGRILLVAMIQATSGRRFEEKVFEEWQELGERARYFYTVISLASSLKYPLSRDELIRATESTRKPEDLAILEKLVTGRIITKDASERYGARHHLIAKTLMKDLVKNDRKLPDAYVTLAWSVTQTATPGSWRNSRSWRFIKHLINNKHLFRCLGLHCARAVYEAIEEHLHWDYHYWLQRGSLEVSEDEGDLRRAQQYLDQARGLNPDDDFVVTEYAYMLLRKAVRDPFVTEADMWIIEGERLLRGQIASRGDKDAYPIHVLGSQALAWVRRCRWSREDRIGFLRGILAEMQEGVRRHRDPQLNQLENDVRHKLLALVAGIEV